MSAYIMKVGLGTSFLDQEEELRRRGELPQYWNFVTRALLNPLALDHQIF